MLRITKNLIDALHSTPFSAFWDHLITTFEHHRLRCQIARSLELVHLARSNKSISVLNIDNVCPALCVIYTLIMHSWTIKIISFVFWWKFLFWQDSIRLPNLHNSFVSIWLFTKDKHMYSLSIKGRKIMLKGPWSQQNVNHDNMDGRTLQCMYGSYSMKVMP